MRICIIQPHFLPFAGYFELMENSDLFVFYDDAQFVRASWHSRTPIIENNEVKWLTIPAEKKGNYKKKIKSIRIFNEGNWKQKLIKRLQANYHNKSDNQFLAGIIEIISENQTHLADLNVKCITYIAEYLQLPVEFAFSSQTGLKSTENQDKILEICQYFNANTYICGPGSRFYIRDTFFNNQGISINWIDYNYAYYGIDSHGNPVYPSMIDVILRKGVEFARDEISKN